MKDINMKVCCGILLLLIFLPGYAFSQSSEEDSTTGFSSFESVEKKSSLSISGSGELDSRLYVDSDQDNLTETTPSFDLGFDWKGSSTEVSIKTKYSESSVSEYSEDILQEMTFRAYLDTVILEAGKMKLVWGKGDKLHVVDNFNANDYTDFLIPDYIDRRLAEKMLHTVWSSAFGMRFEAVYTPTMTADRIASSGFWVPKKSMVIKQKVMELAGVQAAMAMNSNDVESLFEIYENSDSIYPETSYFKYGQAGLRMTTTNNALDWGLSYYIGHFKQPSIDWSSYKRVEQESQEAAVAAMTQVLENGGSETDAQNSATAAGANVLASAGNKAYPVLQYDRLQVFGVEGARVFGFFNTRGEFAYYLTDDIQGDDPWVHNNSFNWVVGFDVDIPIHNININLQNLGAYIINNDEIDDEHDTDYDSKGRYSNNKLALKLSDTFLRENIKLTLTTLYGVEFNDLILQPEAGYTIADSMDVALYALYITGDSNSEYSAFQNNSLVGFRVTYKF